MRIPFMRLAAWYLVFAMFIIGIAPKADAGFSPSDVIAAVKSDRAADIDKIQAAIESKVVRDRLERLGFTQDEISGRLAQLSDNQLHNLALDIDQLKVGGDGFGIVIGLLVIAILIVLLLNLTGHRVVVTK